jgi:ADP-ribosylglycohydrolase
VRNAVSLGGDSDTQACIAGAIAEAFYGVPREIKEMVRRILPLDLLETLDRFNGSI